jgi:tetratricopeptide (TPR) repeat protein
MKNLTSFVCFVLLLFGGFSSPGQNSLIKKGDEAYKLKNYAAAIDYYMKVYEKNKGNLPLEDSVFIKKLANCYKFTNQYDKASEFYDIVLDMKPRPKGLSAGTRGNIADNFEYADMLLRSGDFKGARSVLKTLEPSDDTTVVRMIRSCDFAESELKKKLPEIFVENMATINSGGSDFGLGKNNDALIFASNRINTKQSVLDGVYNQEFTDLYTASKFPETIYYGNPEMMKGEINSEYNDGTFTRAPGKNWALTTQCVKNPEH